MSFRLYVCPRIYENNSRHILHQHSEVVQPAMQLRVTRSGLGKSKDKRMIILYAVLISPSGLCWARKPVFLDTPVSL